MLNGLDDAYNLYGVCFCVFVCACVGRFRNRITRMNDYL